MCEHIKRRLWLDGVRLLGWSSREGIKVLVCECTCFLRPEVEIRQSRKGTRKQSILQDVAQRTRVLLRYTPIKISMCFTDLTLFHHPHVHKDIYFCFSSMYKGDKTQTSLTHTQHSLCNWLSPSPFCQKNVATCPTWEWDCDGALWNNTIKINGQAVPHQLDWQLSSFSLFLTHRSTHTHRCTYIKLTLFLYPNFIAHSPPSLSFLQTRPLFRLVFHFILSGTLIMSLWQQFCLCDQSLLSFSLIQIHPFHSTLCPSISKFLTWPFGFRHN